MTNIGPKPFRIASFGEVLLRLSPPGRERLLQSPHLQVWFGGAEANVATALAQLGHRVAMISAVPDTMLGDAAVANLRGLGVEIDRIVRAPGRLGQYWVETGAGLRATEILYDRAHSAFAGLGTGAWDWATLLDGVDRLHLSGITPALGPAGTKVALAAAEQAGRRGIPISFDGNYRPALWGSWQGDPQATLRTLIGRADILFGNHRDLSLVLDRRFCDDPERRRREAAEAAFEHFPNLRLIASTARHCDDVDNHRMVARVDTRDGGFQTGEIRLPGIVDRIGTGDAFAAGVLHGELMGGSPLDWAKTGLALSALKHSLPGDALALRPGDLDHVLGGQFDARR